MPKEHLPVRTIREVLRLKNEGFSNRAIARVCQVSNSTVGEYLEKAKQAGLSWPLPEGLSEETLYQRLFLEKGRGAPRAGEAWCELEIAVARVP
jgi:transposase